MTRKFTFFAQLRFFYETTVDSSFTHFLDDERAFENNKNGKHPNLKMEVAVDLKGPDLFILLGLCHLESEWMMTLQFNISN